MSLIIETSLGDLEVDLFVQKAPEISKNFLKLCKLKHYNNALFYEVQKNYLTSIKSKKATTVFVETGGDQQYIHDEIDPTNKHNKIGLLSTSNIGQDRNTSEFFITLTSSHLQHFDEKHTIFGQVQVGIDILEKFNTDVIVDNDNKPYINHRILHTIVIDDPFEDPENLVEPDQSPLPIEKSDNDRLEFYEKEKILNESDKTEEEIIEEAKLQIQKMREIKLQMIGDIPDADMRPPENVLFVCQLNPVTQERDLEIIFSRFGVITRCEVVRDWKTGQSLQYAFIEFETEKSCQEAYFKMKGALIDERRVHVDFCQSLQKFKNNKKPNQNQSNKKLETSFENIEFSKFYRNNNYNTSKHKMVFDQGEDKYANKKERLDSFKERERERYRNNRKEQENRSDSSKQDENLNHHQHKRRNDSRSQEKDDTEYESRHSKKDRKRSHSNERQERKQGNKDRKRSDSRDKKREKNRSNSRDRKRNSKSRERRSASKEKKRKRSLSPSRTYSRSSVSASRKDKNRDRKHDSKRDRSRSQKKKDKKQK
ncbi:peptidyl-prolyl cis-trans isomerase, cyclophilin-type protein, putative (macronuclear) [Tetrahymena thermophila SB210]|uniref:Peptidyl-prolyl cis-trans isomerase n=1 Tax=Tetrahymena thermophila (strain SB210) TaxID=312017 RepID=Q23JQ1_TETTS|nr:peptidyl-prolyl cis-trans isomerase, cyclophilin-type protein, putative [Tetrahymena thermophila SB210]EAR96692.2 peptidyl-prolyl cis-trans isomerase, cyclophilin-type protein, putative [Tetrahymena thermophila SB210]|eukprot:XP_001016937.2 peptidyl-prolyl cis-trans isomerase, cyclophilin-type protein, putative [Tetrahymena thermophila SB210]